MRFPLFGQGVSTATNDEKAKKKPGLLRRGARFPRAWEAPPERKSKAPSD